MALALRERTFELLELRPTQRFKAREIAEWIHANYPDETSEKMSRSTFIDSENTLLAQIVAEIGSNRPQWQSRFPNLRTTEGRPRQYYCTDKSETEEVLEAESAQSLLNAAASDGGHLLERDLYPMLIQFAATEFGATAFRIDEGTASNRRGPGATNGCIPTWLLWKHLP